MAGRPRRTLGISATAAGAAAGSVVPGVGTVAGGIVGDIVGSLFGGGKTYATQTATLSTPKGPVQVVFTGAGAVSGSAQEIFYGWAQAGHLDWLQSIAQTGSGPKWDNPSQTYSGYGSVDRNFAAQLVADYAGALNPLSGVVNAVSAITTPQTTYRDPLTGEVVSIGAAAQPAAAAAPATTGAGFGTIAAVGIGAAVLVSFLSGTRRRANPRRRRYRGRR